MKRDFLKELGLEDEIIDKVMAEHGKGVENAKGGKKELEDKIELLEKQIKEKDSKIDELAKGSDDAESLKKQILELQETNKKQTADWEQFKIDSAVELVLANAKAKNAKAVKSLLDLTNAEFDGDGKIKGLDDQIKKLQESDGYLFNTDSMKLKGMTPGGSAGNDDGKGDDAKSFGSNLASVTLSRMGIKKNKE
ncbi:MAG: phage scaffolding protein [Alphaproteobacteria bacterium]|nr:phage scaffolding protein [Alphaproteobacteria bacterium]